MSIVFPSDAVHGGKLAGVDANSYSAGNATGGSEEAVWFKK
jgi:formate dehydrogenase